MHETLFVQDIINQAKKHGDVCEITVEVGSLAPIEPNQLKYHLQEMVDWKINIVEKKGIVECECGFKGEPEIITRGHDFVLFKCPWCGDVPKIVDGNQIILKEVKCA